MTALVSAAPTAYSITLDIQQRKSTATAVLHAALDRIHDVEPRIKAWVQLDEATAFRCAESLDRKLAQGVSLGLLCGVPFAVKDIFDTQTMPTSYGARPYSNHRPTKDADVVTLTKCADATIIGKTVTTEFAYFSPGPTVNPWRPTHTPGGSSSGSAAAVASGMVPLALGSQTAGSLIRPASYCGVYAFKPTYGAFSTGGAKPFSESLDTIGWLANNANDLELYRSALLAETSFRPLLNLPASSMRVGICQTHEWNYLDESGKIAWDTTLRLISKAGARATEITISEGLKGLLQAQKTIMAYEAARNLEKDLALHADRLSIEIFNLVREGVSISQETYFAARVLAEEGRTALSLIFEDIDVLMVPAAPGEAPEGLARTGDPVFSRVWTLLGCPCACVPGILGPSGLPVGIQVVGAHGNDRTLLECAATIGTWLKT